MGKFLEWEEDVVRFTTLEEATEVLMVEIDYICLPHRGPL